MAERVAVGKSAFLIISIFSKQVSLVSESGLFAHNGKTESLRQRRAGWSPRWTPRDVSPNAKDPGIEREQSAFK